MNIFLQIGNWLESNRRYSAAFGRSGNPAYAEYFARTSDGEFTENGFIVGAGFWSPEEMSRRGESPIIQDDLEEEHPVMHMQFEPAQLRDPYSRPSGGCTKQIRRDNADWRLDDLEVRAAAVKLVQTVLDNAIVRHYDGDITKLLVDGFKRHQHEFSPCQRRQMVKIIRHAILIVTAARSVATEV